MIQYKKEETALRILKPCFLLIKLFPSNHEILISTGRPAYAAATAASTTAAS